MQRAECCEHDSGDLPMRIEARGRQTILLKHCYGNYPLDGTICLWLCMRYR